MIDEANLNIEVSEAQGILQELAAAFPLVNTVTVPSIATDAPLPEIDAR